MCVCVCVCAHSLEGSVVLIFLVMCGAMWCMKIDTLHPKRRVFLRSAPVPPIAAEAPRKCILNYQFDSFRGSKNCRCGSIRGRQCL